MEIEQYINLLKSSSPAPGGGSASALASMFSASLNSMASLLSLPRKNLSQNHERYNSIIKNSEKDIDELKILMDEDEKNFLDIMDAFHIDKSSTNRNQEINNAIKKSIITSWKIAIASLRGMENALYLMGKGNKNLITDNISSVYMGYSGVHTSLSNIGINLKFYHGEAYSFSERVKLKLINEISEDIMDKAKNYEKNVLR